MLITAWSQDSPYNDMCPKINNTPTLTGCGATSLAQILNYHKYPDTGFGENTYSHDILGEISLDFSQQTYNWSSTTDDDIAKLNYHCGVAINMDFRIDYSSSFIQDIVIAFKLYFKYSSNISLIERSDFTDSQWLEIIKTEIDNNRPVVYRGYSDTEGGHIWICDGYDDNGFVHMNWGWGDISEINGFYNLNALDTQGMNFNSDEMMIVGIEPSNDFKYLPDISFTESPFGDSILLFDGNINAEIIEHQEIMSQLENAYVMIAIKNKGNKIISGDIDFEIQLDGKTIYNQASKFTTFDLVAIYSNYFYVGKQSVGKHTVTLIIDPENKIEELNENNNKISISYIVADDGAKPNMKPALYATNWDKPIEVFDLNWEMQTGEIFANTPYYIAMSFSNEGIDISDTFFVSLYVNNELFETYMNESVFRSNETKAFFSSLATLKPGVNTIAFVLDSGNDINESNEGDNTYETSITFLESENTPISKPIGSTIICDARKTYEYSIPEMANVLEYIWTITNDSYQSAIQSAKGNSIAIKWNDGIKKNASITVQAQFNNGELTSTNSLLIEIIPSNIEIFSDKTTLCHDDSIKLYANNTVIWNDGYQSNEIYVTNAGTYIATSAEAKCLSTQSNSIEIKKTTVPSEVTIYQEGQELIIENNNNVNTTWYYNNEVIDIENSQLLEGNYFVVLTDNTCTIKSDTLYYTNTLSLIKENSLKIIYKDNNTFEVHPADMTFTNFSVFNILGMEIKRGSLSESNNKIIVPDNQMYLLRLNDLKGNAETIKLHKN